MADWHLPEKEARKKAKELIAGDTSIRGHTGRKLLLESVTALLNNRGSLDSEARIHRQNYGLEPYEVILIEARARETVKAWRITEGDLGPTENLRRIAQGTGRGQQGAAGLSSVVREAEGREVEVSDPEWRGADEEIPPEALAEPDDESVYPNAIDDLIQLLMPLHLTLVPRQSEGPACSGSHGVWHARGGGRWSTISHSAPEGIADSLLEALHGRLVSAILPYMRQKAEGTPCTQCTQSYMSANNRHKCHFNFPCPHRPDNILDAIAYARLIAHQNDRIFIQPTGGSTDPGHEIRAMMPDGLDIRVMIRRDAEGEPIAVVHVVEVGDVWPRARRHTGVEPSIKVRLLAADRAEEQRCDDDIPF